MKVHHVLLAAALGLSASLASCSGQASAAELNRQAETALQELDYDVAKATYERALETLTNGDESADFLAAKLGIIECLVYLDAGGCEAQFTSLAGETDLHAKEYVYIAGLLSNAGELEAGVAVGRLGLERFPESDGIDKVLTNLAEKAKIIGNPQVIESLEGLGYVDL